MSNENIESKIPESLQEKFNIDSGNTQEQPQTEQEVSVAPNTATSTISQPEADMFTEAPVVEVVEQEEQPAVVDVDSRMDALMAEKKAPVQQPVVSMNPLDNFKVDLNNLEFVEKTVFNQKEDYDAVFNKKSVFDVVACQSAYSASMSAFNMSDVNSIMNSNVDRYKSRQRMYKAVFNHIEAMSIPKPGFNDWLKITSFGDWDTLLFGIYAQTFPDNNDFDIKCGHCGKETSVTIDNNALIETKDADIYGKIKEVVSGLNDPMMLVEGSQVHKFERVMLNDSKCVVEVQTPSLEDYLTILKNTDPQVLENYAETISVMMFIKNFYLPNLAASKATGSAKYSKVAMGGTEILNVLTKLSVNDGKQLEKIIEDRIEKYAISYSINNAVCQHCKDTLESITVDLETLLFTRINKDKQ